MLKKFKNVGKDDGMTHYEREFKVKDFVNGSVVLLLRFTISDLNMVRILTLAIYGEVEPYGQSVNIKIMPLSLPTGVNEYFVHCYVRCL